MRIKVFTAPHLHAALAKVRQDMGPEALILDRQKSQDKDGELYLINAHIPEYKASAQHTGHQDPRRERKLLLHRRQIDRLMQSIARGGYTIVPLSFYFNERGIAKVELGIGKGKNKGDKRQTSKDRDWKRDKARMMSHKHLD